MYKKNAITHDTSDKPVYMQSDPVSVPDDQSQS